MATAAELGGREPPQRQVRTVILGLSLGMLLHATTATIVATALPAMVGDLGQLTDLSWVVTSYLLASTVAVPLLGKASDVFGRRPVFLAAIAAFVVGSLLCGTAGSMGQLIVGRVVQGAAGGGLMALAMTTIGDVAPPRERGRYLGYVGAVFAVATLVAPLVGGILVDTLSWRWVFYVNFPLGILAFAVAYRSMHVPHRHRCARIDYLGAALITVGVLALLLVTELVGTSLAWSAPTTVGLLVTAGVCALSLVAVERRASEPIIPLALFRGPVFGTGVLLSFVLGAALYGTLVFLPTILQLVAGTSATIAGLSLAPFMGTTVIAMVISGRLISRWGRYKVFPVAGTAVAAVAFVLLGTMSSDVSVPRAVVATSLLGLGLGLTMHVIVMAVQNAVDPDHLGAATAATQFFRTLGGTMGLAVFGALVNHQATSVFLAAFPLMVVAVVVALFLRELPLREHADLEPTGGT